MANSVSRQSAVFVSRYTSGVPSRCTHFRYAAAQIIAGAIIERNPATFPIRNDSTTTGKTITRLQFSLEAGTRLQKPEQLCSAHTKSAKPFSGGVYVNLRLNRLIKVSLLSEDAAAGDELYPVLVLLKLQLHQSNVLPALKLPPHTIKNAHVPE